MNYGICSLMARIALVHSLGLSLMVFLDMPTGMPLGEHYSLLFYGYTAIVWVSMVHTHSVIVSVSFYMKPQVNSILCYSMIIWVSMTSIVCFYTVGTL